MSYPTGYNIGNAIVSSIRIKNPYGSIVDNDYYENYHVDVVLMDAFISYSPGEKCTKYMEWVALLQKIVWNTEATGEIYV